MFKTLMAVAGAFAALTGTATAQELGPAVGTRPIDSLDGLPGR